MTLFGHPARELAAAAAEAIPHRRHHHGFRWHHRRLPPASLGRLPHHHPRFNRHLPRRVPPTGIRMKNWMMIICPKRKTVKGKMMGAGTVSRRKLSTPMGIWEKGN
nr:uncharacterized protein LOC127331267 [Lolium perenne]